MTLAPIQHKLWDQLRFAVGLLLASLAWGMEKMADALNWASERLWVIGERLTR